MKMTEYIELEAFLKDIEKRYCLPCKEAGKDHNGCMCRACWVDDMRGEVIDAPTADVAPVVHGRWKLLHKGGWTSVFVCSVCGRRETITESESYNSQHKMPKEYPYCHCGARMDGDSDAFD